MLLSFKGLLIAVTVGGDIRCLGRLAVVGRWKSAGSIKGRLSSLILGPGMMRLLVVCGVGRGMGVDVKTYPQIA